MYEHILDDSCKKLDRKNLKCIFVGYSDQNKAYRLWDMQGGELVIGRDVVFDESNDISC